ncbi:MAG: hypothetical protein D6805_01120 [Planctomycetota bacterium]|nr:MAG: hypothetical protein D6805_01120 [Planctomycetota bacterium]
MWRVFVALFVLVVVGCCGIGGGEVETERILSMDTPRQTLSRLKCAILYGKDPRVAYRCFSKNTRKRLSFFEFRYGFRLIDYVENPELKLYEVLLDLRVRRVVYRDVVVFRDGRRVEGRVLEVFEKDADTGEEGFVRFATELDRVLRIPRREIARLEQRAQVIAVVGDRIGRRYKYYSELIYMVKEEDGWKVDLERTLRERGGIPNLDEEELAARSGGGGGGGCVLVRRELERGGEVGVILPWVLFWLLLVYGRVIGWARG